MMIVANLIKRASAANSSSYSDKFILTLQSLTNKKGTNQSQQVTPIQNTRKNVAFTDVQLNLPQQNVLAYIAGYLCHRIITGHELLSPCHTCREVHMTIGDQLDDHAHLFIHNKAYDT